MLRWKNTENRRFYKASIQTDLFGNLFVLLEWGSEYNRRGNYQSVPCQDLAEVKKSLRKVFRRRKQKRYQLFP